MWDISQFSSVFYGLKGTKYICNKPRTREICNYKIWFWSLSPLLNQTLLKSKCSCWKLTLNISKIVLLAKTQPFTGPLQQWIQRFISIISPENYSAHSPTHTRVHLASSFSLNLIILSNFIGLWINFQCTEHSTNLPFFGLLSCTSWLIPEWQQSEHFRVRLERFCSKQRVVGWNQQ